MMQTQREFWRGSMVLLGCNTLAGVLNYAFQVFAARRLEIADYGSLNLWIADITIALSIGTIAQMVANYFPMTSLSLRKLALSAMVVASVVALALGLAASDGIMNGHMAGVAALGLGLMSGWLNGQVQARMQFALLGMALVAGAGLKFLIAGLFSMQGALTTYYLAVSMSFLAPIALIALRSLTHHFSTVKSAAEDRVKAKIVCASLLALATALIPQLDIINIRQVQTSEVLGQYARVMLAAKAIFFGAAAILQVALPFHLRPQDASRGHATAGSIRRAELTVVGMCFVASGIAALVLPLVSPLLLRFDLTGYRLWIFLTGLIASLQFALLQEIQRDCARLAWRRAGLVLLALCLVLLWGLFGPVVDVGSYLFVAAVYYAAVLGLRLRTVR